MVVEPSAVTAGNEEAFSPLEERMLQPDTPNERMAVYLSFFPTAEGYYDYKENKYIYQYKPTKEVRRFL